MKRVKVCLWNIQNYGQSAGKYNASGDDYNLPGFDNALRNRFIAAFVDRHQIDVLMIMEVQPSCARASLSDLVSKLNAASTEERDKDWAYSYCGCAISNDTVDRVRGAADLINRTGARTECYAVVWRHNRPYFEMVDAIAPIAQGKTEAVTSPLNISQLGRPTGYNNFKAPTKPDYGAIGGFARSQVYPYRYWARRGYRLMDAWPKLKYPQTSIKVGQKPTWAGSRRPAYVVIELDDEQDSLCPIMAYHAPSNKQRAAWGAYMAGLARELYVIDDVNEEKEPTPNRPPVLADYGFVGGDYNYAVSDRNWPADYTYFVRGTSINCYAGAAQDETPGHGEPDADRRTTVQILKAHNPDDPITGVNTNDYLRYMIDLGFYRSASEITAERIDLLNEVITNPVVYRHAVGGTASYMRGVLAKLRQSGQDVTDTPQGPKRWVYNSRTKRWALSPFISGAWGGTFVNWDESLRQFNDERITDARRAAEYIHIFVSDHLPLVATIPF